MKDFLKYVLANFVAFAIVGGACMVMFLLLISSMLMSGKPTIEVPSKAVMVLNLSTPIIDKPVTEDFGSFMQDVQGNLIHNMSLKDVLDGLDYAAKDDRILALYLTGNVMTTSWANLTEVREAIVAFKSSGKPVIAFAQAFREQDYYLASAADQVLMHPMGVMELNGFASELMFYKNAFDKYGVDIQVTRVGKYKSAVEPMIQSEMSEENREQVTTLLNDTFDHFLATIADARGLVADQLRGIADTNILLTSEQSLEARLVDKLVHYDEVLENLNKLVGSKNSHQFKKQVSLYKYMEAKALENMAPKKGDRIVVIYAEGTIVDGSSRDNAGGSDISALLRRARLDETCKAVVLRINSPGGTVSASEVIGREANLLKKEKPLIASFGGLAASGGYWIATHADEIYADPNTLTGSIGVYGMYMSFRDLMNTHGLNIDVAKTSPMADAMSPLRPKTDAELASIQVIVDKSYDDFLARVSDGRNIPKDQVHEIAQGRVWSGVRAKELGLVDNIGGLKAAVAAAAEKAGLENYQWHQYQRPKKFAEELIELMEDKEHYIKANLNELAQSTVENQATAALPAPMRQSLQQIKQTWEQISVIGHSPQPYAILPFTMDIR